MAKKKRARLQQLQYNQIISKSRPEAEEVLQKLGMMPLPMDAIPYSHRMSAQIALAREGVDLSTRFVAPDFSQLKEQERIIAYYARPDVQSEMYRFARGRYLTVLRNFRPMYSALQEPEDVLPLMLHYLKPKGNRWPSMHGTISRHNEAGKTICDYVFEPDFKKNWANAFSAARPIVQLFLKMGLPFFVKYSGSTSPHIIVPGEALATGTERGLKKGEFREAVYSFVKSRMHNPGLLDGPNWKPDHFIRLPYSIHELGGKVSMPIKPEEFDSFKPDMARIENVVMMENWWQIPEDAAERGREFVNLVLQNYPTLVSVPERPKHEWKPPPVPRKLRQVFDANWYAKILANGRQLLANTMVISGAMMQALDTLKRWKNSGMTIDLSAAADVFSVDAEELEHRWQSEDVVGEISSEYHHEYYSRAEIQEAFHHYSAGRCFRVPGSKSHFRLEEMEDIPLLAAFFESSRANWRGFECTRGIYSPTDNTIVACDIGMEIDFSRSDYTSAVELAHALTAVLRKYEVFCFVKFDGNEALEIVIPAEALPKQVDGQATALQINQIASGLNRGFRHIPEVDGNDCALIIHPYGYTRPAYSLNLETGLACIVLADDDLQEFSPEQAEPDRVLVSKNWLDIPQNAPLQAQRFLKYALSHNWQPTISYADELI